MPWFVVSKPQTHGYWVYNSEKWTNGLPGKMVPWIHAYYFIPFVKKREYFAPVMQMIFDYYKSKNLPVNVKITGEFIPLVKPLLGDEYQINPGFGDTEYIYKAPDIVNLPGKKYSTKRNQVEVFEDRYFYFYWVNS